ncbi:MAG: HI0074 family nucleotidyltransferase substrate-binding subunit [Armatimonadetes bacterium]|nr:HI0074 family nucleotidyltransferase substrate-binding subunit [Armatimonadota bacterium]
MDRVATQLASAEKALATLHEALAMPSSVVVRDASIQRFEYTYEVCWKALKVYLADMEGVAAASPNQCFREALRVDLVSPEEAERLLDLSRDRNLTSHTYVEAIAEQIARRLPDHAALLTHLLVAMRVRVGPACR